MPSPSAIERAAAKAWPSVHASERDGWLVRSTPGVHHRRNNSALPLGPVLEPPGDVDVVAIAPAEERGDLDEALARRGWTKEAVTDVMVAAPHALSLPPPDGVVRVDPLAWPDEGVRSVVSRSAGEVVALADGDDGATLCIRTGDVAGIFRLHVAPGARRRGVARRLLAACAEAAPGALLYAQVLRENEPGQALFRGAGFTRSHSYHYRRRPPA